MQAKDTSCRTACGLCPHCRWPVRVEKTKYRRHPDRGRWQEDGEGFRVECPACGARGPWHKDADEAVALWRGLFRG